MGAAGVYADILCDLLQVEGDTKGRVVKAAMLHDAGKVEEIKSFRQNPNPTQEDFEEIMQATERRLKHFGLPMEIVELSGASVPTQQEVSGLFNGQKDWMPLERQIVWYVDAMLWGDKAVDPIIRMEQAVSDQDMPERQLRNQLIHNLYVYDQGGQRRSLHEVQLELAKHVGAEFIDRLRLDIGSSQLPQHLEAIYHQKIARFDPLRNLNTLQANALFSKITPGTANIPDIEKPETLVDPLTTWLNASIILNRIHFDTFGRPIPGIGERIIDNNPN